MIHAFAFVMGIMEGNGGHGPNFIKMMTNINQRAGTNITVYHNFHDEVNHYKNHWWRCNGPCVNKKPFYGYVKRTSNRAPSKNDLWWNQHQNTCGGIFIKVKEPEPKRKKAEGKENKKASTSTPNKNAGDIRKFFSPKTDSQTPSSAGPSSKPSKAKETGNIMQFKDLGDSDSESSQQTPDTPVSLFHGTGYVLGGSSSKRSRLLDTFDIKIISKKPEIHAPQNIKQELEGEMSADDIIMIDNEFDDDWEVPDDVAVGDTKLVDRYFESDEIVDLTEIVSSSQNFHEEILPTEPAELDFLEFDSSLESPVIKSDNTVSQDLGLESLTKEQKATYDILISAGYSPKSARETVLENVDAESPPQAKRPRLSSPEPEAVSIVDDPLVDCPSCEKKFAQSAINQHLDDCLKQVKEDEEPQAGPSSIPQPGEVVCPICNKLIFESVINSHLDVCLGPQ